MATVNTQFKKGTTPLMLKKVIDGSKDYQVLCANCNWIKKVDNKELPNNKKSI